MTNLPKCPACGEDFTYQDGHMYVCPICFHEWSDEETVVEEEKKIRDAVGNIIENGAKATIIKDLKMGSEVVKQGSKVTNVRILDEEVNGPDLDGTVEGFGSLYLKSSVIKIVK